MTADEAGDLREASTFAKGGLAGWQARLLSRLAAAQLGALTVRRMAAMVDLSVHHFSRAFRITYGASPREWLIEAKMRQAAERLLNTVATVEEIAIDLGYSSGSQFSRIFRARLGTSPQTFRRQ